MSEDTSGNAVRLYVFVDTATYVSKRPLTVIINKYKSIGDLKQEFEKQKYYAYNEQYWVFNYEFCYDCYEINQLIKNMVKIKKGYLAYLYMMDFEEKDSLTNYFGTYVENKFRNMLASDRCNEPEGVPMIIADVIDTSSPRPVVGWNCDSCTYLNKPFLKFCDVCGNARPDSFQMPKNFYYTKEDKERIERDKQIQERARKLEEENIERMRLEQLESLEKLRNMYKKDLVVTLVDMECPTCMDDIPAGEGVILRNCMHTICKNCFKEYLNNITDPTMKCFEPNCSGHIEDQEIREILSDEEFERYQQLSLRTAEAKTEHSFHCKTPNCTAWVIYDDNVNFFDCPVCKSVNCLLCKAIHPDQTCKEYQDELAIKARNDEVAKKDMAFLQNMIDTGQAMKCPGCQIIVQKKSGCDWMQCNMCKTEICWATKGPRWGPKGKGDTSGGCKCRVDRQKCHPNCGNCH